MSRARRGAGLVIAAVARGVPRRGPRSTTVRPARPRSRWRPSPRTMKCPTCRSQSVADSDVGRVRGPSASRSPSSSRRASRRRDPGDDRRRPTATRSSSSRRRPASPAWCGSCPSSPWSLALAGPGGGLRPVAARPRPRPPTRTEPSSTRPCASDERHQSRRRAALEDQRDFLLRSLEDLEREHAAGDVDEHDYAHPQGRLHGPGRIGAPPDGRAALRSAGLSPPAPGSAAGAARRGGRLRGGGRAAGRPGLRAARRRRAGVRRHPPVGHREAQRGRPPAERGRRGRGRRAVRRGARGPAQPTPRRSPTGAGRCTVPRGAARRVSRPCSTPPPRTPTTPTPTPSSPSCSLRSGLVEQAAASSTASMPSTHHPRCSQLTDGLRDQIDAALDRRPPPTTAP